MNNEKHQNRTFSKLAISLMAGSAALLAAIGLLWSVNVIDEGEKAVVLKFGEISHTWEPGLHFKVPIVQTVKTYSTRIQKTTFGRDIDNPDAEVESKAQEEISFPKDNIRPDLALVFSANPYDKNIDYVDAVLIELKRRGKGKFYLSSIEDELMERANTLQDQCSKLRRAWYYGIMDFMECGLEERDLRSRGFIPLFSSGHCYYKSIQLFGKDNQSKQVGILDFYLMDYTAVITDAESRLSTFRNVLQKAFSK